MEPYLTFVDESYLDELQIFKSKLIPVPPPLTDLINARPHYKDSMFFTGTTSQLVKMHYDFDETREDPNTTTGTCYKDSFSHSFLPVWHFQSNEDIERLLNPRKQYNINTLPFILENTETIASSGLAFINVWQPSQKMASQDISEYLTKQISNGIIKPIFDDWTYSTHHFEVNPNRHNYLERNYFSHIEKNKYYLLDGIVYLRLKVNTINNYNCKTDHTITINNIVYKDGDFIFLPMEKARMYFEQYKGYKNEILGISGDYGAGIYHSQMNSFFKDYYMPEFIQSQKSMTELENSGLLIGSEKILCANIANEIDWYRKWRALIEERQFLVSQRDEKIAALKRSYNEEITIVDSKLEKLYRHATKGGPNGDVR